MQIKRSEKIRKSIYKVGQFQTDVFAQILTGVYTMAPYVSIGVNSRGIKQIISMDIYSSEDEMDWNNFFFKPQERGLSGV